MYFDFEAVFLDLTDAEEMTQWDYLSLIIFEISNNDCPFKGQVSRFPKMFRDRINSSTNAQEKRFLESMIHYSHGLGTYYGYLDDVKEYGQSTGHLKGTRELDNMERSLKYILEELKTGRDLLAKEDSFNVDFFNRCILHVKEDFKKIESYRKLLIESRKYQKEQEIIKKQEILKKQEREKMALKLWYLAPLVFGFLGGVIGYVFVRDRRLAKNLFILGVLHPIIFFILAKLLGN